MSSFAGAPARTRPPTSSTTHSALSSASASQTRSTPVGVIVGPIVGVVAVVLLVLAFFLYRRKRRPTAGSSITPFNDVNDSLRSPPILPNGKRFMPPMSMPVSNFANSNAFPVRSGKHRTHTREHTAVSALSSTSDGPPASVDPSSPVIQAIQRDIQQLMQLVGRPRTQVDESPPDYAG
jgi:hypothetical protein